MRYTPACFLTCFCKQTNRNYNYTLHTYIFIYIQKIFTHIYICSICKYNFYPTKLHFYVSFFACNPFGRVLFAHTVRRWLICRCSLGRLGVAAPTRKLTSLTARCVPITIKFLFFVFIFNSLFLFPACFVSTFYLLHYFFSCFLYYIFFGGNCAFATAARINQWQLTVMQMSFIIKSKLNTIKKDRTIIKVL